MYFGLAIVGLWALAMAGWYLLPNAMATVYDLLIVGMTKKWYAAVLKRIEPNSRVFDIGIGTATALLKNKHIVLERKLTVIGIDYEKPYVVKAKQAVAEAGMGLSELVHVHHLSIHDPNLRAAFSGKAAFDAAYFSGSLTLLPDPAGALKIAAAMLKPGGCVYVTQTFQNQPAPIMSRLKPLLRRFTSIDFGRLTYYSEVQTIAAKAGMKVIEDGPIPGSIDTRYQTARLVVLKPM